MIADYYASKDRGKAFGLLFMVSILGGLGGGLLATNLGGRCETRLSPPPSPPPHTFAE